MSSEIDKRKKWRKKLRNITIIIGLALIVPLIINSALILLNEENPTERKQLSSEFIKAFEFDQEGNLKDVDVDNNLGSIILEIREMPELEKFDSLVKGYSDQEIHNNATENQKLFALAYIYADHPKEFVQEYGEDKFREFQIVEVVYRVKVLNQTTDDLFKLAELQRDQFGFIWDNDALQNKTSVTESQDGN